MIARFAYFNGEWRQQEKQAVLFLLKLLFLLTSIKLVFAFFNWNLLGITSADTGMIICWSVYYDFLVLLVLNLPLFILLWISAFFRYTVLVKIIISLFAILNTLCLLINFGDVIYFHFHLQRADADLLYVIRPGLGDMIRHHILIFLISLLLAALLLVVVLRIHKRLLSVFKAGRRSFSYSLMILAGIFFLAATSPKKYVPTYPLTMLNSSELQLVQNSLHTFLYSVFRDKDAVVHPYLWMSREEAEVNMRVKKNAITGTKKNVVLFIMESIPAQYFDNNSVYKVKMPFLDSLVGHSMYFKNAFSYSHNSNKGIVAILAGLPTLTEIPLYHSQYADLNKTAIGTELQKAGYNTFFTIGDNYDDFGFAKCCNWVGLAYYCRDNIPLNSEMQSHTMGLHDEYVLDYFSKQSSSSSIPFFAVNYNISTHYPNDLPKGYNVPFPNINKSNGMKSMEYYSDCLKKYFAFARQQPWFNNSVFIFCSDHWMYPDEGHPVSDVVDRFRIPIFIYDPSNDHKQVVETPVSQLDIINTVLHYSGIKDSIISYGEDLSGNSDRSRVVFMKENNTLYQAVDSSYVLGFNPVNEKVEFVYNYKSDLLRKNNLKDQLYDTTILHRLKAFLQVASWQYNRK